MKILHIAHNHPDYHAGGTEIIAKSLSEEMKGRPQSSAVFLGAALPKYRSGNAGTPFLADDRQRGDPVITGAGFERLILSQRDARGVIHPFRDLLEAEKPDVVHFHHFLLLGMELLNVVRRTLPHAAIVVTLHDYYLMCHNDGLMIRTETERLCDQSTPARCAACFPKIGLANFRLRELFIKHALSQVDAFVAPSLFLLDRFAAWGLDRSRLTHIPNGYPVVTGETNDPPIGPETTGAGRKPVIFGFFGHLNHAKGVLVVLEAMRLLRAAGFQAATLRLHGSDTYADEATRSRIAELAGQAGEAVERLGPYERDEVSDLMADVDWIVMSSIWWENDPLVLNEAFLTGRPVICSGIGGMKEKVRDGVDGLHARPNDPRSWAAAMRRALEEPELGPRLSGNRPAVPTISDCADQYFALYEKVLKERTSEAA
ncbi:MAG: glycosyltransferase [Alphaproteobacteria bacterium]|jgi:glycosyltransferase involved in cell wall biosynthesis|nr:glycosyltransferase [Alphaproteobacteria bacterium]